MKHIIRNILYRSLLYSKINIRCTHLNSPKQNLTVAETYFTLSILIFFLYDLQVQNVNGDKDFTPFHSIMFSVQEIVCDFCFVTDNSAPADVLGVHQELGSLEIFVHQIWSLLHLLYIEMVIRFDQHILILIHRK